MSQAQPKTIIRRRGAKRVRQQIAIRTDSEKLRQIQQMIDDNKVHKAQREKAEQLDKNERGEKVEQVDIAVKLDKQEKPLISETPEEIERANKQILKIVLATNDNQSNSSSSDSDKNAQKTAPASQVVDVSQVQKTLATPELGQKSFKKKAIDEPAQDPKQKKIKQDDNYEQRFCEMKCELQSFLCFWMMRLKSSILDSQQMLEQLERIKL